MLVKMRQFDSRLCFGAGLVPPCFSFILCCWCAQLSFGIIILAFLFYLPFQFFRLLSTAQQISLLRLRAARTLLSLPPLTFQLPTNRMKIAFRIGNFVTHFNFTSCLQPEERSRYTQNYASTGGIRDALKPEDTPFTPRHLRTAVRPRAHSR